jgi:2,3-dihydroxybenzoate decarboxylase
MCSAEPLACTISALGHQHVMFSADYPFESIDVASEFIDHAHLSEDVRADICFNNAARLFGLPRA